MENRSCFNDLRYLTEGLARLHSTILGAPNEFNLLTCCGLSKQKKQKRKRKNIIETKKTRTQINRQRTTKNAHEEQRRRLLQDQR